ncbi:3-ketoacyl-ACP reductase [Spirochaetia bacterium]|nr:3-ketoacyl-ACP reductase [Spirochaetia bacterium]
MSLINKTAVITGSSSGIGKAVALLFAEKGANVILCSHSSISSGESVLNEVKNKGSDALYISADLRHEGGIKELFSAVSKKYGSLDILINNAGRTFNIPFDSISEESFLNDIQTNLLSTVLCSKHAVQLMTNENAWIVNTSSIRGFDYTGRPGIIGYCAAKSGINSFTKNLAYQLAPKIFVNAIAPGFVHTNYIDAMPKEAVDKWMSDIPIGRLIGPAEIAEVYYLLATSKIFTGAIVTPDGGYGILGR